MLSASHRHSYLISTSTLGIRPRSAFAQRRKMLLSILKSWKPAKPAEGGVSGHDRCPLLLPGVSTTALLSPLTVHELQLSNKDVERKARVTYFSNLSLKKGISLQKGIGCCVMVFFLPRRTKLSADPSSARTVGRDGCPVTLRDCVPCIPQHPAYHSARQMINRLRRLLLRETRILG